MKNIIKLALLPCVAALTFAVAPAQAVTIASSAPSATSASQATTPTTATLSKKELKRQAKLRKKCAKLASGKIKSAKKRARLAAMCKSTVGATTDEVTKTNTASAGGTGNVASVIASTTPLFTSGGTVAKTEGAAPSLATGDDVDAAAVPEPGTLALLGLGLVGLGFARRRVGK